MSPKTIILSSCAIAGVLAINPAGVMAAEPTISGNFSHSGGMVLPPSGTHDDLLNISPRAREESEEATTQDLGGRPPRS
jgi:hypothetical protein